MKKKMGRPRLSDESAKDVLIGARFGEEEAVQVDKAAKQSDQGKSEWLRQRVVSLAQYENTNRLKAVWTKTPYKYDDLAFQKVEFRLPVSGGFWSGTNGAFWVKSKRGLLSIEVVTNEPSDQEWVVVQRRFQLQQPHVDRIEIHPDQSIARYRLLA